MRVSNKTILRKTPPSAGQNVTLQFPLSRPHQECASFHFQILSGFGGRKPKLLRFKCHKKIGQHAGCWHSCPRVGGLNRRLIRVESQPMNGAEKILVLGWIESRRESPCQDRAQRDGLGISE